MRPVSTEHVYPMSSSTKDSEDGTIETKKIGLRDRVDKFTWAWFTCTQSTGGIAILLFETPHQFEGLQTIGAVIFVFNLILFLCFVAAMLMRWFLTPSKIRESFTNPPENYFFGSFWLSIATIIMCMQKYGVPHSGPWLLVTVRILFWMYAIVTFVSSTVHIVVIFQHTPIKVIEMNPAWFLLIFNTMLTGTVASAIVADQPPEQRMAIIVAGVSYQGLGWIASMLFLVHFVGKNMEKGWVVPDHRPGQFMPVGASGYTIVALIGMARALPSNYDYFAAHPLAPEVLLIVATWVGIFMWMFTFWLFGMAFCMNVIAVLHKKDGRWQFNMGFHMSWWAFIFPNVGFTIATIFIGQELESQAILMLATVMTVLLVAFWLFDLIMMAKYCVLEQLALTKRKHDQ